MNNENIEVAAVSSEPEIVATVGTDQDLIAKLNKVIRRNSFIVFFLIIIVAILSAVIILLLIENTYLSFVPAA